VVVPQGWKASMAEPAGARQAVPRTTTAARADARGGRDTDRDGAADGIDRCPGTPAGAPVDARGCPSDSDADGVLDGIDRCAGTPLGSPVDAHGCPIAAAERRLAGEGRLRLACECSAGDPVFAPAASAELDVVARLLERRPTLRVEVGAHTDGRGTTERNRAASLRCAQRVVDAVRARHPGLAADRFVLRGFGEEQPLAPNDTEAGRAQNRRVEVVLLEAVAPVR
jgi:OOP family OmpA-OmpF porin